MSRSPERNYQAYQPPSQPYHDRDVSPIEGNAQQFPSVQNTSPPPPPAHRNPVGIHPDSHFSQMQNQRQYAMASPGSSHNYSNYSAPGVTPGADNLSESSAGGGINGIAYGVAGSNERESGAQALRDINNWGRNGNGLAGPRGAPLERNQAGTPFSDQYRYDQSMPQRPILPQASYGSNAPLAAGAMAPAGMTSHNSSQQSIPLSSPPMNAYPSYNDSPYNRYSSSNLNVAPQMGMINPNEVEDDDDWGMGPSNSQQKRRSFVPFGGSSHDSSREGAGAGAGAGAIYGARDASGNYAPVPASGNDIPEHINEKSEWLKSQNHGRKKLMWILVTVIAILVVGAIVGGVLGAVLRKKGGDGGSGGNGGNQSTPESVAEDNKDELTIKSAEIQELMNNKDLHKVFPGMDYTPLNTQYPECIHAPPSQNNVTRDMAVLSQLTNAVRLYGTDCNQTEMVMEAIKRLELKDMKVWLGVWLGDNQTTNDRQIEQMYTILDDYDASGFKGIILGNEVLFREDLTETELLDYIHYVKGNLSEKNIPLPIATSDLGDNWTAEMAEKVDIVMSNVHPFFAGVTVDKAAGWTWDFWTTHDVILTQDKPNITQIVAEVGWPSEGGNNCGSAVCASKTEGSIAGIDEMNKFMEDWVCQSLRNGTEYFWFEAFDEPWKIRFNEPGKEWEDKWGLMDINRNLKDGVKIPDCGGQTPS
ncbi:glycoside hydrolase [Lojkania enalia]|uniref:glucan endo-1,3-beta-D-glucosidase n=1 Tax=Lojkania enalia TaxID=147567 RepID=A0A9P4KB05_9PLEO|nr:glycoside hydrolase [Didymosphaeria enalia]